jgi:hypothetical protein
VKKNLDSFGISIVPIIQSDVSSYPTNVLDHGYSDLPFFPSWRDFLDRSSGKVQEYLEYMAYVVMKQHISDPIGVVAVQFVPFEKIRDKVPVVIPDHGSYLYLSWVALDRDHQNKKYFEMLFHFYRSIVKQLSDAYSTKIGGAAILIRRMRPLFWNILNQIDECPSLTHKLFSGRNKKMQMVFLPAETLPNPPHIAQDYVMIEFY